MRPIAPLALALALLIIPLVAGCPLVVGAGAVYGVVQWKNNEASVVLQEELEEVWEATKSTLEKLQYEVTEERLNGTDGHLEGTNFNVELRRYPEHTTRVTVRVGTFETQDNIRRAELILEDVQARF